MALWFALCCIAIHSCSCSCCCCCCNPSSYQEPGALLPALQLLSMLRLTCTTLVVVIVALLSTSVVVVVNAQRSDAVRVALTDLYLATHGETWFESTNWLIGDPCPFGVWYGIVCNDYIVDQMYVTHRLTPSHTLSLNTTMFEPKPIPNHSRNLPHNNLTGSIPDSIGNITSVTVLYVH
jgi:hypothetical protein